MTVSFDSVHAPLIMQLAVLGVTIFCYFLDRRKRREELEEMFKLKSDLLEKRK